MESTALSRSGRNGLSRALRPTASHVPIAAGAINFVACLSCPLCLSSVVQVHVVVLPIPVVLCHTRHPNSGLEEDIVGNDFGEVDEII